ncbi:TonB-linked outer membrane protein, SusC/RagA family [Chitinophaga costaii]|uniref:TonB-linked outer membrane protein, SusC/RagA family n=1 Tax=Chitinophaga costaii TaxID=1335309 RepID=A0A1C4DXW2_9BACT|nr:SusC/RagA family TonB-linked outer membrane protein [Chitinophaga costaii]SCC36101.1 TonB-linked outer membrane protein, SusC/RagA family [Chitinophaga costaii]
MKKALFVFVLAVNAILQAAAQNRTVSGKVTDAKDGSPIPGASVVIKGTHKGTVAGPDGSYSLVADANATLVISFVGFNQQEIPVSKAGSIQLAADNKQLGEVLVTALGIQRSKRALGYSVGEVKGADLVQAPTPNLVNALAGKVAGLQVTESGGAPGEASRIVLRGGATSLLGDNQPLFVVDGIPISNSNDGNGASTTSGGQATPNRAADINPNDIESISILKGPAASTLYGIRAAAGAIIITTKSGKSAAKAGRTLVDLNSSYSIDGVLRLPDYQTTYAQGNNGNFSSGTSSSWGPKIEGQTVTNVLGEQDKLKVYNPRKQFLQHGGNLNNNLSIATYNDKTTYYFSAGNNYTTSYIPNQDYKKTSLRANASTNWSSKFTSSFNLNYINTNGKVPFLGQDGNNPLFALMHTPVSYNLKGLGYQRPDGTEINFRGGSFDNPYWSINNTSFTTNLDRMIGSGQLSYKPLSWIDVTYRIGTDFYNDSRKEFRDIHTGGNATGFIANDNIYRKEVNSDLLVTLTPKIGKDWTSTIIVGNNVNNRVYRETYASGQGLILPGKANANISNAASQFPSSESDSKHRLVGAFLDAKFAYKNLLFLGVSARNDWSSTLPKNNNSFFYPSVDAAFVFTDLLKIDKKILSFGKIRANVAQLGKDADPYQLATTYSTGSVSDGFTDGITFPFGSNPGKVLSSSRGNANIVPEKTTSYEVGAELKFLNDRIGLDFSYFNSKSKDQIIPISVANSTGYNTVVVNAGQLNKSGIELSLNLVPVKTQNFQWDMTVNYSRIRSKVVSLYPGVSQIYLGGFSGSPAVEAIAGQRYGSLFGTSFLRDDKGNIVVDADGNPETGDTKNLGYTEPDWIGSVRSSWTYKNLTLSVLFDGRFGGTYLNGTEELLDFYGVTKITGQTRDAGANYIFKGVTEDGKVNTTPIARDQNYWQNVLNSVDEAYAVKNNWAKFREVSLTYQLPERLFTNSKFFRGVAISAMGHNLALFTKIHHIDPESSTWGTGNGQGAGRMDLPTTRSYGLNVHVSF